RFSRIFAPPVIIPYNRRVAGDIMSKFTIKVKLQGLEIEVEGTKEDAPKIYQELGKQVGGLLQSPAVLASGNGNAVLEGDVVAADGAGAVRKPRKPKKAG